MSSNTPLPVPSRAALRALRGIVLGTSCTLALITEDRRRRINTARSAIHNGDRIRSARRYRSSSSSSALASVLEEEGLSVEPGVVHWHAADAGPQHRGVGLLSKTATTTTTTTTTTATHPGLLDWSSSLAPSQQRLPKRDKSLTAEHETASEHQKPSTPGRPEQPQTQQSEQSRISALYPPGGASRYIQQPLPSLVQQADEYRSRIRQTPRLQNAAPADAAAAAAAARLVDLPTAIAQLAELTSTGGLASFEAAVKVLQSATSAVASPSEGTGLFDARQLQALWDASSALCRACQDAGHLDLAQAVLRLAIRCGQLDEAAYFAHNPLPLVAALVPSDVRDVAAAAAAGADAAPGRRDAAARQLRDAVELFLPPLTGLRSRSAAEFGTLGRQLLDCAFALGNQRLTRSVYASLVAYKGDMSQLTYWYIGRLHQSERYKLVIWSFLARPSAAARLSNASYLDVGDWVVEAVRRTRSPKAGEMLRALATFRTSDRRMRVSWVADLLHLQWRSGQKYETVQELFASLVASKGGLAARVHHPDGVYRVMVQIALEAGETAEAQRYFDELKAADAAAAGDIRLLGLFALQQAKQGDWDGVREQFETAVTAAATAAATVAVESPGASGLAARDTERVFVPIVKEYARTHTIGETEDFLKSYIDGLGVPVGRQLVTLLANEYGALREVQSFVGWLEYCAQAGFAVDAAFSNAILNSCRKHWKFGFRDLRTLYRKLSVLSPNFADRVTQTIMTHAAISDAKHMGRPVKGRILSLRAGVARDGGSRTITTTTTTTTTAAAAAANSSSSFVSPLSTAGRHLDEDSLYLCMKQAFASGHVAKVVRIYRQAVRGGLLASEKCLKLAVAAAVRSGHESSRMSTLMSTSTSTSTQTPPTAVNNNNNKPAGSNGGFDAAIELLRAAQAAGQDIDAAAAYVAVACIDVEGPAASARRGRNGAAAAVQSILRQLQASDVCVSDLALNRAAFHVFKAGHMRAAIALALSAANTPVGGRRPGYNVWNFAVLVAANARLADAEGIRMAVEGASCSFAGSAGSAGSAATGSNDVLVQPVAYKVLKQARRRLRAAGNGGGSSHGGNAADTDASISDNARRTLLAVEDGLQRARIARRRLSTERLQVEAAALDIMRRAALDAGCEPVDFDDVPFLHRRQPPADSSADSSADSLVARLDADAAGVNSDADADADDLFDFGFGASWDLPDVPVASAASEGGVPMVACQT